MFAAALILGTSTALFFYWFRYTVILVLRTRSSPEYAQKVAAANHLAFLGVRQSLHSPSEAADMGALFRALLQDYRALKYLLGHAASVPASDAVLAHGRQAGAARDVRDPRVLRQRDGAALCLLGPRRSAGLIPFLPIL
jgi:hypothetical protein